jgi:uncharacterized protein (DUF2237 family)
MEPALNVLGTPLKLCSRDPLTGWFRDGCCNTEPRDAGSHTVCAQVTAPFLAWLAADGNDLITPRPEHGFTGLKPGDRWCVCAASWRRAHQAGRGCAVDLEATHRAALAAVSLDELLAHAVGAES